MIGKTQIQTNPVQICVYIEQRTPALFPPVSLGSEKTILYVHGGVHQPLRNGMAVYSWKAFRFWQQPGQ